MTGIREVWPDCVGSLSNMPIEWITLGGDTQPRDRIDPEVVDRYRVAMVEGSHFPPVVVFFDDPDKDGVGDYWLADGWHRYSAARSLGHLYLFAEIRAGTLRDAQWHSFSANAAHGLPRNDRDIDKILRRIFVDEKWRLTPVRDLQEHTGIPKSTIHRKRELYLSQMGQVRPMVSQQTRGGTTYPVVVPPRAPEFLNNDATWQTPDAYRPPDNVVSPTVWRQTDLEDFAPTGQRQARPGAAESAEIGQLLLLLSQPPTLTPGTFLRLSPLPREQIAAGLKSILLWLQELETLLHDH